VWCCAYAVDDGPVTIWTPGDPVPFEFVEAARNPGWRVVAFNDAFERSVEDCIMGPRYGWPFIPILRHACLQASASALALPASLGGVASALGLAERER
jgi:DNA polymerase bacteriophage-type